MSDFKTRWFEVVHRKSSQLVVGLDPTEQGFRNGTLTGPNEKLSWCLDIVGKVAPFAAAIKPNRQYIRDFSREHTAALTAKIHEHGMLAIDDCKLADIGSTNEAAYFHDAKEGFDALTYCPFPGNLAEATKFGMHWGVATIALCLMSNEEFRKVGEAQLVEGTTLTEFIAQEVHRCGTEAIVIGAPSPTNQIDDSILEKLSRLAPEALVLCPGIGAQNGDPKSILNIFGRRAMLNIGRSIIYSADPAHAAKEARRTLHGD